MISFHLPVNLYFIIISRSYCSCTIYVAGNSAVRNFSCKSPCKAIPFCSLSLSLLAVITALKSLQEKIRKLELDRSHAKANLEQLSYEAKQYQDKLQEEKRHATSRSRSASPARKEERANRMYFQLYYEQLK